jgi:hypothetical protein
MGFFDEMTFVNRVITVVDAVSGNSSAISRGARREGLLDLAAGRPGEALLDFGIAALAGPGSNRSTARHTPHRTDPVVTQPRSKHTQPQTLDELLKDMGDIIGDITQKATDLEKLGENSDAAILRDAATTLEEVCRLVKDPSPSRAPTGSAQPSSSAPASVLDKPSGAAARRRADSSPSASPAYPLLDQKPQYRDPLYPAIQKAMTSLQTARTKLSDHRRSWWGPTVGKAGFAIGLVAVVIALLPIFLVAAMGSRQTIEESQEESRLLNFAGRGFVSHTNPNSFFARDSVKKVYRAETKLEAIQNLRRPG